jgi:hypothetical protein
MHTDLQEKNIEFEKIDIENRKLQDSISTRENELSALEKGTCMCMLFMFVYLYMYMFMCIYLWVDIGIVRWC